MVKGAENYDLRVGNLVSRIDSSNDLQQTTSLMESLRSVVSKVGYDTLSSESQNAILSVEKKYGNSGDVEIFESFLRKGTLPLNVENVVAGLEKDLFTLQGVADKYEHGILGALNDIARNSTQGYGSLERIHLDMLVSKGVVSKQAINEAKAYSELHNLEMGLECADLHKINELVSDGLLHIEDVHEVLDNLELYVTKNAELVPDTSKGFSNFSLKDFDLKGYDLSMYEGGLKRPKGPFQALEGGLGKSQFSFLDLDLSGIDLYNSSTRNGFEEFPRPMGVLGHIESDPLTEFIRHESLRMDDSIGFPIIDLEEKSILGPLDSGLKDIELFDFSALERNSEGVPRLRHLEGLSKHLGEVESTIPQSIVDDFQRATNLDDLDVEIQQPSNYRINPTGFPSKED